MKILWRRFQDFTRVLRQLGYKLPEIMQKGFQIIHRYWRLRIHESNKRHRPRLHLGCGEVYLPGYVNIDLPPQHHTVMRKIKVDIYADISRFYCITNSVEEIRLHHVFEHFDRPTALRLLISWYLMLKDLGRLVIETPDFEKCAQRMFTQGYSLKEQMLAARHIFGSHEAPWASHRECWYRAKFALHLGALGFSDLSFDYSEWHGTFNITVVALKRAPFKTRRQLIRVAKDILHLSLVDSSESEKRLLEIWSRQIETLA